MQCAGGLPPGLPALIGAQTAQLFATQTAPFLEVVTHYGECVQRWREAQVRLSQLDKEGAELRDENAQLHARLVGLQEAAVADWQAQAKAAQAKLAELEHEVSGLYKDKARLLEEVVSANAAAAAAKQAAEALAAELEQARAASSKLHDVLALTEQELRSERAARQAASGELQARIDAREAAMAEAEELRAANADLVRRLIETKEKEAQRVNEDNKQHAMLMEQMAALRKEAAASLEALSLMRQQQQAAGGSGSASAPEAPPASAGFMAAFGGRSLREVLGLQSGPRTHAGKPSNAPERPMLVLPDAPYRTVAAHKGACSSLAAQAPAGHLAASCGADHLVQVWDMHLVGSGSGPSATLTGMTAAVNDVAFTCDGAQVIAAGTDKSLLLWDLASGQTRHTLTGHGGPVGSVATHPLDVRLAMSCGEDRALKLWDLARGFCVRSIPCAKMPNVLACSKDGNIMATGHLDGSVCLWDVRQWQRGGSDAPITRLQVHGQLVTGLSATSSENLLLTASKDNTLALLDVRVMSTQRVLRAPGLMVGTLGSLGKGRCTVGMSPTGQYVAAGGDDGGLYVWDLLSCSAAGAGPGGDARLSVLRAKQQQSKIEAVIGVAWSANGAQMVSADKGGQVAFWSLTGL